MWFDCGLETGSQHDLNLNLGMSAASSPKESGWLDSSRTLKVFLKFSTRTFSQFHLLIS